MSPGQKLHAVNAKHFKPNGWVDSYPTWDDYDAAAQAAWELIAADFAALTAPARGDGAEWVTVPREPTEAMLAASGSAWSPNMQAMWPKIVTDIYRAMIAAAPAECWRDQTQYGACSCAAAPAAPAGDWRPIESAPRDGTPILACSVNHDAREVICWQDGLPSETVTEEPCEGWVNDGSLKDRFWANPRWFTHWQPLPLPPAPVEES